MLFGGAGEGLAGAQRVGHLRQDPLKDLVPTSSDRTSIASRTGMPAFMKTAICREKCMSSRRGTFSRVISNLRMLFFSSTLDGREVSLHEGAPRHARR